jgi:acylphosphatase
MVIENYRINIQKGSMEEGSSMNGNSLAIHAFVHGHVQGVYFRAFVSDTAVALGITGWVHNAPTGAVEVQAEGNKEKLDKLISELHVGPPHASVDRVDVEWAKAKGKFTGFRICYE